MPKLQDRIAGLEAGRMVEIPEVVAMSEVEAQGIVERLAGLCEGMGKRRVEGEYSPDGWEMVRGWHGANMLWRRCAEE